MYSIDTGKLFFGAPEDFKGICYIYPLQIKKIIGLGEETYNKYLGMLTLEQRELEKFFKNAGWTDDEIANTSVYDNLFKSCIIDSNFLLDFKKAMFTFIREEIHLSYDTKEIYIGELDSQDRQRIMTEQDFYDFQNVLRIQNGLHEQEPIPENESPMAKKFRLRREQVAQAKKRQYKGEGEAMTIADSIECLMLFQPGITIDDIGNYSIYTFKRIFNRALAKYKYDLDVRMIAAGADPSKIKPKFWLGKLDQ